MGVGVAEAARLRSRLVLIRVGQFLTSWLDDLTIATVLLLALFVLPWLELPETLLP